MCGSTRQTRAAPQEVIAIGDTAYDMESASKMGVCTIGFLCGGGTKDELERAGCIAVYSEPADLLEHYDGSPLSRRIALNIERSPDGT